MAVDPAASIKALEKKVADLTKDLAALDKRVTTAEGSLKDVWSLLGDRIASLEKKMVGK